MRSIHGYGLGRLFCLICSTLLMIGLVLPGSPTLHSQASALGTCTVTDISPNTVSDGSDTGFSVNLTDSSDDISWVQVTSPSGNLVLVSANSDWLPNVVQSSDHAYFFGDPIAAGNEIEVDVEAIANYFPPSNWTVQASTNSDGSNPFACTGDTGIAVTDTTPPEITGVSATALTTSATVSWSTDKVTTGEIDYGKSASYGISSQDNALSTDHSITLTGLSPATTYHYRITATDESNNTAQSVDSTFFTATVPVSHTSGSPGSTVTNPRDRTPPTINITSKLPKVLAVEPVVTGMASDNDAVASVAYSTDNGQNWLPVEHATGVGTRHVDFSFHPINLDDGTYTLVARAVDGGGNSTTTKAFQIVIDRLPPVIGGSVVALGPQILTPGATGIMDGIAGVPLSFHASSTGGVTNATISGETSSRPAGMAPIFSLQLAADSGLWSGTLSFSLPGTYALVAHAVDGAHNKSTRTVGVIRIHQPGRVLSTNGPVAHASVTAYYRDPDTNDWTVWDGAPYGQTNPQTTDAHGGFQMFLPPGTYYLRAGAGGYQDLDTASFTLKQPKPMATILHLAPSFGVGPVGLPWFSFATAPLTNVQQSSFGHAMTGTELVGKALPALTLTDTNGNTQNSVNWLGKPTLVTLLSTWAPGTAEQLAPLTKLAANHDINVKVVGLQENAERLRAYDAIAGSTLTWLADPTSRSVDVLNAGSLPMHYVVDRSGIIRAVVYGVLTYQQLISLLSNTP